MCAVRVLAACECGGMFRCFVNRSCVEEPALQKCCWSERCRGETLSLFFRQPLVGLKNSRWQF